MPELPEVEGYRRYFVRHGLEQRIARVVILDPRILGDSSADQLRRRLRRARFISTYRHGKHLFVETDGGSWVRIHFGMTGDLTWYETKEAQPRFARLIFDFENGGHLAFEDARLFGVVELSVPPKQYVEKCGLGIDPLDSAFRLPRFRTILSARRGAIKAHLMSQKLVAGLGNLYVDEALFQSSIHPRRLVQTLRHEEITGLFAKIRHILNSVIESQSRGRTDRSRFLLPHRKEGARCPRCGGTIRKSVVAGRTTYFCAKHQK